MTATVHYSLYRVGRAAIATIALIKKRWSPPAPNPPSAGGSHLCAGGAASVCIALCFVKPAQKPIKIVWQWVHNYNITLSYFPFVK